MQTVKRVEQKVIPFRKLSIHQETELQEAIEDYQAGFAIAPHPLQANLLAFIIWEFESQSGIFETAMTLPSIMAELAELMVSEQDENKRSELSRYQQRLNSLHSFFMLFLDDPVMFCERV